MSYNKYGIDRGISESYLWQEKETGKKMKCIINSETKSPAMKKSLSRTAYKLCLIPNAYSNVIHRFGMD